MIALSKAEYVRQLLATGASDREVAAKSKVSRTTVQAIRENRWAPGGTYEPSSPTSYREVIARARMALVVNGREKYA